MYAGSQGAHVLLSETLAHLVQMPCKVRLGNLVFWSEGWAQCLVMPWKNSTPEPHLQALLRWSWLQQFSSPHIDSESGTELWSVPIPKLPLILSSVAQAGLEFPVRPRVDPPTSTSQVWPTMPDLDSAGRLNSGSCCILNNRSTAEQLPPPQFLQARGSNADMPHCCKAAEISEENREVRINLCLSLSLWDRGLLCR